MRAESESVRDTRDCLVILKLVRIDFLEGWVLFIQGFKDTISERRLWLETRTHVNLNFFSVA